MASTPRIAPAPITGPSGYLMKRFSTRLLGAVPDALGVLWHHKQVLRSSTGFGRKVAKWDQLDTSLKTFAHMAVASKVGCSWCLDFNYFMAHTEGLDEAKASQVPCWRTSGVFTPLERDVLEYAEAITDTPPRIDDELFGRLHDRLGSAAMIELTSVVAFANMTTRSNTALGIESQEFSKACSVPLATRPTEPATA